MSHSKDRQIRCWTCIMRWEGREPFQFGNVYLDAKDKDHQVRIELTRMFNEKMASILPIDTPLPEIIEIHPGAIFFVPEEDHP